MTSDIDGITPFHLKSIYLLSIDDAPSSQELEHSQQPLIQAVFALQLSVLQEQLKDFDRLQKAITPPSSTLSLPRSLPVMLTTRQSLSTEKRLVDEFEESLLHLLDRNGLITLRCKVNSFILLMNMTIKVSSSHQITCFILISWNTARCAYMYCRINYLQLLKNGSCWMAAFESCVDGRSKL